MTSGAKDRPTRQRIDLLLVERGLADSREKARALALAGSVLVDGRRVEKAGEAVPADSRIEILAPMPFVSRGGLKLAAALDRWAIDVTNRAALDIGASTGGFTDCLLQRGASRVYAFDTGAGQLHWRLRHHPRVVLRERFNARFLSPDDVPEPVDLAVCDVSFISATLIVPRIPPLLAAGGTMVILVKPQFEVGRHQVGKGGIVRSPELRQAACQRVAAAVQSLGFHSELMESPIPGAEGNREFLLYARPD